MKRDCIFDMVVDMLDDEDANGEVRKRRESIGSQAAALMAAFDNSKASAGAVASPSSGSPPSSQEQVGEASANRWRPRCGHRSQVVAARRQVVRTIKLALAMESAKPRDRMGALEELP